MQRSETQTINGLDNALKYSISLWPCYVYRPEKHCPTSRTDHTRPVQPTSGVSYSSIIIQNEMSFGTLPVFLLLFYFISAVYFFPLFFASFLFRVFSTFFTCHSPFNGQPEGNRKKYALKYFYCQRTHSTRNSRIKEHGDGRKIENRHQIMKLGITISFSSS